MRTKRQNIERQLDKLFSKRIRGRDKVAFVSCPFHAVGGSPIEVCFHFITRAKRSVRWDELNAVGSCYNCNDLYEKDVSFMRFIKEWYKSNYGPEAWQELVRRSNTIRPIDFSELQELKARLEIEVGKLEA